MVSVMGGSGTTVSGSGWNRVVVVTLVIDGRAEYCIVAFCLVIVVY